MLHPMQTLSRANGASSSYKRLPAFGENVRYATRDTCRLRAKARTGRQESSRLRPPPAGRSPRLEARRGQLEARELEAGRYRAADQRPGPEARGLLPGAGRHHRLRALAGGKVGPQPHLAPAPRVGDRQRQGAPAYQCQASDASTRCQRDTSPAASRK